MSSEHIDYLSQKIVFCEFSERPAVRSRSPLIIQQKVSGCPHLVRE